MDADDDRDALIADARAACPGFEPARGPARRTLKSRLLAGTLAGEPVIAKQVTREDGPWRWYLAREAALYRAFARAALPVRAPRFYAADDDRALLVIERLPGAPLAAARRARAPLDPRHLRALVDAAERLARFEPGLALAPRDPPPAAVRAALRDRLLEDPTDPLGWVLEGIARCAALGIVTDDDARAVAAALRAWPRVAFAHGDLLLRNALADGDGVALVDWECAGAHPQGWDLALAWACLPDAQRALVVAAAQRDAPAPRRDAFRACAAYALAREVKFRDRGARSRGDPVLARLERDLAETLRALPR